MKMEMGLRARLEQRLRLAPQIIQSIEILQLPLFALLERIEQEQNENPALEIVDTAEESPDVSPDEQPPVPIEEERAAAPEEDFSRLTDISEEYREYFWQESKRRYADEDDPKLAALQNTPSQPASLQDHLMDQVRLLEIAPETKRIADVLINNIDRDGRLSATVEEIAASLDEPTDVAQVEEALKIVQSLEPPGVGARDLRECLLLQLDAQHPDHALHRDLILRHLEDVEHNRLPHVAKTLGVGMARLKEVINFVCHLDPAPGSLYDREQVPYVVPDVIVEMIDGRYEVYLNEGALPRLRVSSRYRRMLRRAKGGSEEQRYLKKNVESARWLMDAIEQRKETLLKISSEIVRAQHSFLDKGPPGLKPLKMQEVANATGVHVSTVSRAISRKYMQTPSGIFPMKFFFSGGMRTAEGEDETWNAVKVRIREIVDAEDKKRPLSDDEIEKRLAERGLKIARRTITKYRKLLNIPSSRQRRQY